MKSRLRDFYIMVLLVFLIGCGSEPPTPTPVDGPAVPPQDSGAGKNIKSRIPPQSGSRYPK